MFFVDLLVKLIDRAAAAPGVSVHRGGDGGGLPAGKPAGGPGRRPEEGGHLAPDHGAVLAFTVYLSVVAGHHRLRGRARR